MYPFANLVTKIDTPYNLLCYSYHIYICLVINYQLCAKLLPNSNCQLIKLLDFLFILVPAALSAAEGEADCCAAVSADSSEPVTAVRLSFHKNALYCVH